MAGRGEGLTLFFLYLLLTSTIGPLLFGFHLVRHDITKSQAHANEARPSSMLPKES